MQSSLIRLVYDREADMNGAKGIDVSHHQGNIDWQQVKAAGIQFAFIRASFVGTSGGFGVDKKFVNNWQKAQDAGILITAYHFFIPQINHTAQIDFYLDTFGSRVANFPLALDFERRGGLNHEQIDAAVRNAVQALENRIGKKPMIYTRGNWWGTNVNRSPHWAQHALWVANFDNPNGPILPPDWQTWKFWQHSDKGSVAGVSTPVDLDVFVGSDADLRSFAV